MPTDQNPADLLTRGLSLNKFKDLLQFWTYGPEWLKTADSDWPVNELNCLSDANKKTIQTNVAIDDDQFRGSKVECIPTKSFSNYGKLLRMTELVFRFIKIKCKVNIDTVQSAITYLVKVTCHWSDTPLVRHTNGPTHHWSDTPMVRHTIGPTHHWSDTPLVQQFMVGL